MPIKQFFLMTFVFACMLINGQTPAFSMSEEIAVVVNSDAISVSDVNDRMRLLMVSSGLNDSPDIREKLRQQVLNVLIEEQIKLQEAERLELEITEEEIEDGFAQLASRNNFTPDEFKDILNKSGINIETMHNQIKSQIAWTKVIQNTLRPRISVRDTDIQDRLERLNEKIGTTEYLVAEIFLPVDDTANENDTRALAQKLAQEIKTDQAPFFKVAQQFSQNAGADKGGDIGWVQEGILDEKIDIALQDLEKDEVSNPIRTPAGYHIILLRDKRVITPETLPSENELTNSIGMQRLERLQNRHLMDLKASAFIDSRV